MHVPPTPLPAHTPRWRGVELTVRPYKGAKDTWVLGGAADVMALLEDSGVALAAVAASRFVGGIK